MIQRIQTVYLAIAIILLSIVTFGNTLFSFVGEKSIFKFNSFGITEVGVENGKVISQQNFPFYLGTIALILLCFICLMSYKNLARQFKLGRMIFFIYLVMFLSVIVLSIYGDSIVDLDESYRDFKVGYYLFVAGLPCTFLANISIKRDKKLLESLDRLR